MIRPVTKQQEQHKVQVQGPDRAGWHQGQCSWCPYDVPVRLQNQGVDAGRDPVLF